MVRHGGRFQSQVHFKKKTDGVKPRDVKRDEKMAVWVENDNLLTKGSKKSNIKIFG
jgi:hypothetical protein